MKLLSYFIPNSIMKLVHHLGRIFIATLLRGHIARHNFHNDQDTRRSQAAGTRVSPIHKCWLLTLAIRFVPSQPLSWHPSRWSFLSPPPPLSEVDAVIIIISRVMTSTS